jgi:hypothetical protein
MANIRGISCQHTPPIPALDVPTEIIPTRARPTGSLCPCVSKPGINRKHTALLLVGGVVVQVRGWGREARVVVDRDEVGYVTHSPHTSLGYLGNQVGLLIMSCVTDHISKTYGDEH